MLATLKTWNTGTPPSAWERWRNGAIETLQGTRNPLIEQPGIADTR